jgi:charged multivesicular body protein 4
VHDLIDDMAEQTQIANEISNAISNPVGMGADIDEDELLAELENLQDEDLQNELINIPNAPSYDLPKNSNKIKPKKTEDDDELAAMAQWANS